MALDPRISMLGEVPSLTSSLGSGLKLGYDISQMPRQGREAQLKEQQNVRGDKQSIAMSLYAGFGQDTVTPENYNQFVSVAKEMGLPIEGLTLEKANVALQVGKNLTAQQVALKSGRSAIKGVEGDITFKDSEGNIFSQQTFLDPNTQQTKPVLTDVTGRGIKPVGKLMPVSTMGETVQDQTVSLADRAKVIAEAKTFGEFSAKIQKEPELAARIEAVKQFAKTEAAEASVLDRMEANLPTLLETVGELEALADVATYTGTGRVFNSIVKEIGAPTPKGADARAEYIATVSNALLPLLRATFGAAFTEKEGDKLIATLGDPNSTPSQKKSELRAFVANKEREIRTQKRVVEKATERVTDTSRQSNSEIDDLDARAAALEI